MALTLPRMAATTVRTLFARMISSFDTSFDTFTADLKRAAESAQGATP